MQNGADPIKKRRLRDKHSKNAVSEMNRPVTGVCVQRWLHTCVPVSALAPALLAGVYIRLQVEPGATCPQPVAVALRRSWRGRIRRTLTADDVGQTELLDLDENGGACSAMVRRTTGRGLLESAPGASTWWWRQ